MAPHRRLNQLVSSTAARIRHWWKRALLLAVLLLGLTADGPPPGALDTQVRRALAGERFNFVGWELEALLSKLTHGTIAPQRYMAEPARRDFLLGYMRLVADVQRLQREVEQAYTDPAVEDPESETAEAIASLIALRTEENSRQLLAEAILEEQVACLLVDEGFGVLGQEIPPTDVHFTPLPLLLVVSPRDRIERILSLGLNHGLDVARREAIEQQVDLSSNVSSLVTGIGGLAAYPAMLLESSSLTWVVEVTAHEWAHHYLTPRPLGWNYDASAEARTINETVASIVGKEIGRRMLARYYPEFLPPEPEHGPQEPEEEPTPSEPPAFDFRMEMRETRIRVDKMLAERKIEAAEAYMEERRQEFVANGYFIRKLNQAYFAFHGSYADEPGAAGEDPTGPAVLELRAHSPDLYTFVRRVSRVTTLEEVEALSAEMEASR